MHKLNFLLLYEFKYDTFKKKQHKHKKSWQDNKIFVVLTWHVIFKFIENVWQQLIFFTYIQFNSETLFALLSHNKKHALKMSM